MKSPVNVLEGNIRSHMFRLALPSMGGMLAITIFNLTDTYFVSRLGTQALAAMGFTFPVVMVIGAVATGISMGAGSVLARAVGRGDNRKTHRIATDGILLSILLVLLISLFGIRFAEELFRLLGAEGEALELVVDYMAIWFAGAAAVIIPPVGDSCMRALGDMTRPFFVMLSIAMMNVVLDPILIFGYWGFPAMGIRGAVVATIISRAIGGAISLGFVGFRYRLIDFRYESLRELAESWREIVSIGIPNIINRLLPQLVRAAMTRLLAGVAGVAAVAAIAAGQRIESFATVASMGIGTAIIPIVGQNYGKGRLDRVTAARKLLIRMAVVYGTILFLAMLPLGRILGRIFSSDTQVLRLTALYLRIVMVGTIGLNMYNWLSGAFNAVGKPRYVLIINLTGTLLIILPLLVLGVRAGGFAGMLTGLCIGQIGVGILAALISRRHLSA